MFLRLPAGGDLFLRFNPPNNRDLDLRQQSPNTVFKFTQWCADTIQFYVTGTQSNTDHTEPEGMGKGKGERKRERERERVWFWGKGWWW